VYFKTQLGGRLLFSERQQVKLDAVVSTVRVAVDELLTCYRQTLKLDRPRASRHPAHRHCDCPLCATWLAARLSGILLADHDGTPSVHRAHLRHLQG
jgi:hypothetical protein